MEDSHIPYLLEYSAPPCIRRTPTFVVSNRVIKNSPCIRRTPHFVGRRPRKRIVRSVEPSFPYAVLILNDKGYISVSPYRSPGAPLVRANCEASLSLTVSAEPRWNYNQFNFNPEGEDFDSRTILRVNSARVEYG